MNRNRKRIIKTLSIVLAATTGVGAVYTHKISPEAEPQNADAKETAASET